jgi:thiamine biosynthesis lipoprotein
MTDGLVDPCLGRVMVSLGYDLDLAQLSVRPLPPGPPEPPRPGAWREVGITDDAIRVPPGVALDLGATAKAWAADLVATTLVERLGCSVVVSLGGDLRVLGPGPEHSASWPVQVAEHPEAVRRAPTVAVSGGLATSSTLVRRWRHDTGEHHHLLDPRTGAPVREVFRTVTAAGRSAVAANTATTAALVLGADAPTWLAAQGVTARLVAGDGTVHTVGDWPIETPHLQEAS